MVFPRRPAVGSESPALSPSGPGGVASSSSIPRSECFLMALLRRLVAPHFGQEP
jgi:hypothetical protein